MNSISRITYNLAEPIKKNTKNWQILQTYKQS